VVDSQELRRYISLLLRWSWLIALCALLGAGAVYVSSLRAVAVYEATTTLLVKRGGSVDDASTIYYAERLARTYRQMMTGRPVMEAVIAQLGLEVTPEDLASRIKTALVADTGLVRLSVTDVDPVRAAETANAVAGAFIVQNQAMQQERYIEFLSSVKQQMDEMSALIQETTALIASKGTPITDQEQAELTRLETALAGYRNTYATLSNSYEQMRLTAALSTDSVVVFESARVPIAPLEGNRVRNTALAAIVGAMLAVGIGFLVEYLDDTIKSPDDVSQALGLDTLGIIGRRESGRDELVVAEQPRSPVTEAYRALRTNVRFSSLDRPLRTILVTSPGVTEGKSVTVANLATAMAQAGLKVAAVDGDLRRPRQHKLFALQRSEGLTQSLLNGRVDGHLCAVEQVEGLSVLPTGELPPNPSELLGSQRMQSLLDDLAAQVDVVIIDSPPLLPVTDAAVLARHVDGVLLVVEAGRTRRGAAQHAVESLRQVNANVLGVVLNAVPRRRGGGYSYYYYYYYDRYYEDVGEKRKRRRRKKGLAGVARRLFRRKRGSSSGNGTADGG
jgi:capsular exopolysaccharide synthesis family protein